MSDIPLTNAIITFSHKVIQEMGENALVDVLVTDALFLRLWQENSRHAYIPTSGRVVHAYIHTKLQMYTATEQGVAKTNMQLVAIDVALIEGGLIIGSVRVRLPIDSPLKQRALREKSLHG